MKKYRVLMQDTVNGKIFNFAIYYSARGMMGAGAKAQQEFLTADIVSVKIIEQDIGMEL